MNIVQIFNFTNRIISQLQSKHLIRHDISCTLMKNEIILRREICHQFKYLDKDANFFAYPKYQKCIQKFELLMSKYETNVEILHNGAIWKPRITDQDKFLSILRLLIWLPGPNCARSLYPDLVIPLPIKNITQSLKSKLMSRHLKWSRHVAHLRAHVARLVTTCHAMPIINVFWFMSI